MQLQRDTGANISASNNHALHHDYQLFKKKENVEVYFQNNDSTERIMLQVYRAGYLYIISDQGTMICWETLYIPQDFGTVLSLDNYLNTHSDEYFEF